MSVVAHEWTMALCMDLFLFLHFSCHSVLRVLVKMCAQPSSYILLSTRPPTLWPRLSSRIEI